MFSLLRSFIIAEATDIGFPVGHLSGLFPCHQSDWLNDRPQTVQVRFGLFSLVANHLQSSISPNPARTFRRAQRPTRISVLIRHHLEASTYVRLSKTTLRSVLRRSQPLDGLLRSLACELISSRSPTQDSCPFRGFLSSHSHDCSSQPFAPMPLNLSVLICKQTSIH